MSDGGDSDRLLVERFLQRRDEESFLPIYRRHHRSLYHLSLGMTGSPESAADVVQETWLRAARALETFRWSSSLRTWLTGIAINCCREAWRGTRETNDGGEVEPEPDRISSDAMIDLFRALRGVPEKSRTILVLHEILGYTHQEIAEMLDIDPGTSKSQLSYAKARLRDWFDRRERKGEADVG